MDYETLDKIADSYIPILATLFFAGLVFRTVKWPSERPYLIKVFLFFIGTLLASYGIMFLDNEVHIWPAFSLDYSTHTAVSLTLSMSICVLAPQFWKVTIFSFILYALLMLYQKYHTILDIVSTLVPILVSAAVLLWLLFSQAKDNKSINPHP